MYQVVDQNKYAQTPNVKVSQKSSSFKLLSMQCKLIIIIYINIKLTNSVLVYLNLHFLFS